MQVYHRQLKQERYAQRRYRIRLWCNQAKYCREEYYTYRGEAGRLLMFALYFGFTSLVGLIAGSWWVSGVTLAPCAVLIAAALSSWHKARVERRAAQAWMRHIADERSCSTIESILGALLTILVVTPRHPIKAFALATALAKRK